MHFHTSCGRPTKERHEWVRIIQGLTSSRRKGRSKRSSSHRCSAVAPSGPGESTTQRIHTQPNRRTNLRAASERVTRWGQWWTLRKQVVASPSAKCTNEGRARASLGHVDLGELATGKKRTRKNLQTRQGSRGRSEDRMTLNNVRSNRLGRRLVRIRFSLHGTARPIHGRRDT